MTHLQHTLELVLDIRDCAGRLKTLGFGGYAEELYHAADETERSVRTPSIPPVLAANQAARATASKHFQEARRLLRDINK